MAGDGSMIIDRELDQKGKDENIGTSRVNLTQRYVGEEGKSRISPFFSVHSASPQREIPSE